MNFTCALILALAIVSCQAVTWRRVTNTTRLPARAAPRTRSTITWRRSTLAKRSTDAVLSGESSEENKELDEIEEADSKQEPVVVEESGELEVKPLVPGSRPGFWFDSARKKSPSTLLKPGSRRNSLFPSTTARPTPLTVVPRTLPSVANVNVKNESKQIFSQNRSTKSPILFRRRQKTTRLPASSTTQVAASKSDDVASEDVIEKTPKSYRRRQKTTNAPTQSPTTKPTANEPENVTNTETSTEEPDTESTDALKLRRPTLKRPYTGKRLSWTRKNFRTTSAPKLKSTEETPVEDPNASKLRAITPVEDPSPSKLRSIKPVEDPSPSKLRSIMPVEDPSPSNLGSAKPITTEDQIPPKVRSTLPTQIENNEETTYDRVTAKPSRKRTRNKTTTTEAALTTPVTTEIPSVHRKKQRPVASLPSDIETRTVEDIERTLPVEATKLKVEVTENNKTTETPRVKAEPFFVTREYGRVVTQEAEDRNRVNQRESESNELKDNGGEEYSDEDFNLFGYKSKTSKMTKAPHVLQLKGRKGEKLQDWTVEPGSHSHVMFSQGGSGWSYRQQGEQAEWEARNSEAEGDGWAAVSQTTSKDDRMTDELNLDKSKTTGSVQLNIKKQGEKQSAISPYQLFVKPNLASEKNKTPSGVYEFNNVYESVAPTFPTTIEDDFNVEVQNIFNQLPVVPSHPYVAEIREMFTNAPYLITTDSYTSNKGNDTKLSSQNDHYSSNVVTDTYTTVAPETLPPYVVFSKEGVTEREKFISGLRHQPQEGVMKSERFVNGARHQPKASQEGMPKPEKFAEGLRHQPKITPNPAKAVVAAKKWKVVGSGGSDGWSLLNDDGVLEWKIHDIDGKWKVTSADQLKELHSTERDLGDSMEALRNYEQPGQRNPPKLWTLDDDYAKWRTVSAEKLSTNPDSTFDEEEVSPPDYTHEYSSDYYSEEDYSRGDEVEYDGGKYSGKPTWTNDGGGSSYRYDTRNYPQFSDNTEYANSKEDAISAWKSLLAQHGRWKVSEDAVADRIRESIRNKLTQDGSWEVNDALVQNVRGLKDDRLNSVAERITDLKDNRLIHHRNWKASNSASESIRNFNDDQVDEGTAERITNPNSNQRAENESWNQNRNYASEKVRISNSKQLAQQGNWKLSSSGVAGNSPVISHRNNATRVHTEKLQEISHKIKPEALRKDADTDPSRYPADVSVGEIPFSQTLQTGENTSSEPTTYTKHKYDSLLKKLEAVQRESKGKAVVDLGALIKQIKYRQNTISPTPTANSSSHLTGKGSHFSERGLATENYEKGATSRSRPNIKKETYDLRVQNNEQFGAVHTDGGSRQLKREKNKNRLIDANNYRGGKIEHEAIKEAEFYTKNSDGKEENIRHSVRNGMATDVGQVAEMFKKNSDRNFRAENNHPSGGNRLSIVDGQRGRYPSARPSSQYETEKRTESEHFSEENAPVSRNSFNSKTRKKSQRSSNRAKKERARNLSQKPQTSPIVLRGEAEMLDEQGGKMKNRKIIVIDYAGAPERSSVDKKDLELIIRNVRHARSQATELNSGKGSY